ncbi:MAG: CotH kinase family protein [Firmicutes bacterium]|nr:CotH kinase family protein [Bacillota bacterium]
MNELQYGAETKLPKLRILLYNGDASLMPLESVTKEKYVKAEIGIHSGSGGLELSPAEFKGRGYGSWIPPKKSYRIKFENKQTFLGMPASRHWCLIAGVWNNKDGSLLKSDSAYTLTRTVLKNIEYATRTQPVEVYVNNLYHGVYTLSEKIRVEKNKVNIVSEHNVLDTGYLLNYVWAGHTYRTPPIAKFQARGLKQAPQGIKGCVSKAVYFVIKSPDAGDIGVKRGAYQSGFAEQVKFIQAETQKLADALVALDYEKLNKIANIPSFVDNLIIQELYKNYDYGAGGCYLYKKPCPPDGDGKFHAGPPWDFDWTVNDYYTDWFVTAGAGNPNPFATYPYAMLGFKADVIKRWKVVSPSVKAFIKKFFNYYLDNPDYPYAFGRNFVRWDNKSQAQAAKDWRSDTTYLRDWLLYRAKWLDRQWR